MPIAFSTPLLIPRGGVFVNKNYRIVLELIVQERDIILVGIGHHDDVY